MRRVQEDLLRRKRDGDVGIGHVEHDVAPVRLFFAQGGHQPAGIRKCLGEQQLAPAAIDRCIFARTRFVIRLRPGVYAA